MVIFITSVRHPANSNCYVEVLKLLTASLKSVCNQTDHDFKVLVVANRKDDLLFDHPNLEWVVVNLPAPSSVGGPRTGINAVRRDKGCKYAIGLSYAKRFKPDYIMFFDADDFVNRDIVAFCNERKGHNGWYVNSGYVWRHNSMMYGTLREFHKWCGTCNILGFNLLPDCSNFSRTSTSAEIESGLGIEFVHQILGAHPFTVSYYAERGVQLNPLPFPGAIYSRDTDENHSGIFLGSIMDSWPKVLNQDICSQFGMDLEISFTKRARAIGYEFPREVYRRLRYREKLDARV